MIKEFPINMFGKIKQTFNFNHVKIYLVSFKSSDVKLKNELFSI